MKKELIGKLVASAEQNGLVTVLNDTLGRNVSVRIPLGKKALDTDIDELDLSVRANNAMKRVGVFKVGEIVEMIENDGLLRIRNLGKKTQNEIKTRILVFGYDRLTTAEKQQFFSDLLQ